MMRPRASVPVAARNWASARNILCWASGPGPSTKCFPLLYFFWKDFHCRSLRLAAPLFLVFRHNAAPSFPSSAVGAARAAPRSQRRSVERDGGTPDAFRERNPLRGDAPRRDACATARAWIRSVEGDGGTPDAFQERNPLQGDAPRRDANATTPPPPVRESRPAAAGGVTHPLHAPATRRSCRDPPTNAFRGRNSKPRSWVLVGSLRRACSIRLIKPAPFVGEVNRPPDKLRLLARKLYPDHVHVELKLCG